MEIHDLPDEVLLVILDEIFPHSKMNNLIEVKKVIKIGTVSRHFKRVENLFWRQIVTRNNLFRSKQNSMLYKTNPKLLHLTRYFGCHNCQQLTRLRCTLCRTPLCLKCYKYNAPECGCDIASVEHLCQVCVPKCELCEIRVCGNCEELCGPCGEYGCIMCCEEKRCCACNYETCVHMMELIRCRCGGEKYACLSSDCFLREIQCIQCSKAICNKCGNCCQNCSHWVCLKCSKKVDRWYACVSKCGGSGLHYSTCQQCEQEFAFVDKDTDVGHCGNCEPLCAENFKWCQNCIDTCQRCHRKLCLTCISFHEPRCIGLVTCQKCQMIVSSEDYTVCYRCDRETGCNKCCQKCSRCENPHCDSCLPVQISTNIYSGKRKFECRCQSCDWGLRDVYEEQPMEINDLPTDVFLVILNEIFPKPKMDNIVEVKKIIKIGTISRHFRRVENLFWRQIVTRNNLFRSKRNSTLYKTNPKLMHVTRYFGCHNCQQLTRLQCADCEGLLCLECYQYDASPECGCEISSLDVLCRFCIPTCSCGIRVCGNCTEECGNCGRYCCAKCCSEEKKCCACIRETCVHELNLIGCECKGEKYACLDRCFLQEIQCVQCSKAICNDCGNRCQNCEHWACSKCIKISDSWYTCVNKCEGSGVQYSTCQQCQKEFAFADKDTDVGHCGNCEHQICKNCIDTCQKCHRKLCLTCIRFHEPNCIGLVACQKCQMIVSSENYTVCYRCDRETGCNKCCRKCRRCKQPHCDSCLPHQYPRHPLSLDKEEFVYCCQRCHLELIEDGYYP